MKKSTSILSVVLSSYLFFSPFLSAEESVSREEYEQLQAKVERLEAAVASLQATQIDAISREVAEKQLSKPAAQNSSIVDNVVDAMFVREQAINYPWMDTAKWSTLKNGMSPGRVVKILGSPTTDEPSLHKRVDRVYTYEGRQPSTNKRITGKVRFLKGKVIDIELPKL
ncbi:MAG: hypothetical protein ACSHYA_03300 [Opitutaceae bacterium]